MKKVVFIFTFMLLLFVFKSISAKQVEASQVFAGSLDNRNGAIAVNVVVTYYKNNGNNFLFSRSYVLSAGTSFSVNETDTGTNSPAYSIIWSTVCDGAKLALTPGTSSATYSFGQIDVHCTTTNTPVTITGTSCALVGNQNNGHIDWSIVSTNYGGSNIAYFYIYKSNGGNADLDTTPTKVNYIANQTTYSSDMLNIANGTWNISVKAYSNPDLNIAATHSTFDCGLGLSVPSNLSSTALCASTTTNRVDFNWSPAMPGAYTYVVKSKLGSDPGSGSADVLWDGPSVTPSTTTNTFATALGSFTSTGSRYYWRVKAEPSPQTNPLTYYYSNSAYFDTPSNCATTYTPADIGTYAPIVCASSVDNGDLTDDAVDAYASANPDYVKFKWVRASASSGEVGVIQMEQLEWGTDRTFAPGTFQVADVGLGVATQKVKIVNWPFSDGQVYYYRINTKMNNVWYPSKEREFLGAHYCNSGASGEISGKPIIENTYSAPYIYYGYSYCFNGVPYVHLNWHFNGGTAYSASTQFKLMTGSSSTNLNQVIFTPGLSFDLQTTGTTYWKIIPIWSGSTEGTASVVYTVNAAVCNSNGLPNPPDQLSSYVSVNPPPCDGTGITIYFRFYDQSTNEGGFLSPDDGIGFYFEVSSEPFTGPASTAVSNKWGVKKIYNAAYLGTTGHKIDYSWKNYTAGTNPPNGALNFGDANPQTATTDDALIPLEGVAYYWRVRAVNTTGQSAYVYPDGSTIGTTFPSGMATPAYSCNPKYDLSANFVAGSWRNSSGVQTQAYTASENVTINVEVGNKNAYLAAANSYTTNLYFYFQGSAGGQTMPNCQSVSGTIPVDVNSRKTVTPLAKGSKTTIPVSFNVGTTPGTFIAYAYVVPSCAFSGDPANGYDPDWSNNITSQFNSATGLYEPSGFTYTVGVPKFFEAKGGDVVASRALSVGLNSSVLGTPYYQSKYLLKANNLSSNANIATGGYKLSGYPISISSTYPSGGVYKYFAENFRSKATQTACSITSGSYNVGNKLYSCGDSATVGPGLTTITGNPVFFVGGDLNIKGNITASGSDSVVFIVEGDINVYFDASNTVTSLDGIYIAKRSFNDINPVGSNKSSTATSTDKLTVNGAVYCDAIGGKLNLARGFASVTDNATYPSDSFVFDPKYMIVLNSILAKSDIGWKEVAP